MKIIVALLGALVLSACVSLKQYKVNVETNEVIKTINTFLASNENSIDDPAHYDSLFHDHETYTMHLSEPLWLIPSNILPPEIQLLNSNNNMSIQLFNHRLYVAFRTSKTHFASGTTALQVISTADGKNWKKELAIAGGKDAREPFLIAINDSLRFYFFEAGNSPVAFEPEKIKMYSLGKNGGWGAPQEVLEKGEVHWSLKNRMGSTFLTSYLGTHYQLKGNATVQLNFRKTNNAQNWQPIGDSTAVYTGGVSETDFEFDKQGNLWAVGRQEDGDQTGFGSLLFYAPANNLGKWQHAEKSNPVAYMSPKLFRHHNEIYLIARRQLGKKDFGYANPKWSMKWQRIFNWSRYSLSPKTTTIFKLNKTTQTFEPITDMPGAGDTAFPNIIRLDKDRFLVANYTSPPHKSNFTWLRGQLSKTMIYLQVISFKKTSS
jgi:hypothetical protein